MGKGFSLPPFPFTPLPNYEENKFMSKQLKAKDISALTGVDESKIEKCIKHNFLHPMDFTATGVPFENPVTGEIETNKGPVLGEPIDPKTGKQTREKGGLIDQVQKARSEGTFWEIKRGELSAEEVLGAHLKTPAGKRYKNPRFMAEVENIAQGAPHNWPGVQFFGHSNPNYDQVNWDKSVPAK